MRKHELTYGLTDNKSHTRLRFLHHSVALKHSDTTLWFQLQTIGTVMKRPKLCMDMLKSSLSQLRCLAQLEHLDRQTQFLKSQH